MAETDARKREDGGRNKPVSHRLYPARVTHSHPETGRVDVELDDYPNFVIEGCIPVSQVFAPLLGYQMKSIPMIGSHVLIVYLGNKNSFVLGTSTADPVPDDTAAPTDSESGIPGIHDKVEIYEKGRHNDPYTGAGYKSTDMFEGEFDLSNALNVGLTLLNGLAKLKAGERAKVEACVHNDMVKIVSNVFRNFTAIGLEEIYTDGRKMNAVWDGTHHDHEFWGVENPDSPRAEDAVRGANAYTIDKLDPDSDQFHHKMRSRFNKYLGSLGNFVHFLVTDPMEAMTDMAEGQNHRAGKFRAHVGADGNLLVQSVADITLERVVRIPVPRKKHEWNDPEGDAEEEPDLNELLGAWEYEGADSPNLFHAAYQLREYARWLSGKNAYARFYEDSGRWDIPTEAESPEPHRDADEQDRVAVNEGREAGKVIDAYATIRILRDGSIVLYGADRTAVVLAQENIQISAPRNISLSAGQDINLTAGQDINMKSRRHVEISATSGGMKLKGRSGFQMISDLGSMLFESNAPEPGAELPGGLAMEDLAIEPDIQDQAMIFKTNRGRMHLQSDRTLSLVTINQNTDNESDIRLGTRNTDSKVQIASQGDLELKSNTGRVLIKSVTNSVLISARKMAAWLSGGAGTFSVNGRFTLRGGILHMLGQLYAAGVTSRNIITHDGFKQGSPIHAGHVGSMPMGDLPEVEPLSESDDDLYAAVTTYDRESQNHTRPITTEYTFNYLSSDQYGSDTQFDQLNAVDAESFPLDLESLTFQSIRLDIDDNFALWGDEDLTTLAEFKTPWPGRDRKQLEHHPRIISGAGEPGPLEVPSTIDYDDFHNRPTSLQAEDVKYYRRKRNNE